MGYKIFLKCQRCNKQTDTKDYDVTKERIREIIKIANTALRLPQYIVCPHCGGVFSVKVMLVNIK